MTRPYQFGLKRFLYGDTMNLLSIPHIVVSIFLFISYFLYVEVIQIFPMHVHSVSFTC